MKKKEMLDTLIPKYTRPYLTGLAVIHFFAYYAGRVLGKLFEARNMTLPIDALIPFWKPAIAVYVLSYVFWIVGFILITGESRERCRRIFYATVIGETAAFLCYIFIPTTMERPEVTGSGMFSWLTELIFASDEPNNLFPSLHCYLSYMCWRGCIGSVKISKGWKCFALVFFLMIFASTMLVKQHVFADTLPGVALGEISWLLSPIPEKIRIKKKKSGGI